VHPLRTKRVYEEPAGDDGTSILVDRLRPRGLSREKAAIDAWHKDLAPSDELRKWHAHRAERWAEFRRRYREEVAAPGKAGERVAEGFEEGTGETPVQRRRR